MKKFKIKERRKRSKDSVLASLKVKYQSLKGKASKRLTWKRMGNWDSLEKLMKNWASKEKIRMRNLTKSDNLIRILLIRERLVRWKSWSTLKMLKSSIKWSKRLGKRKLIKRNKRKSSKKRQKHWELVSSNKSRFLMKKKDCLKISERKTRSKKLIFKLLKKN